MLSSKGVDICDDSRVSQMEEGIVDDKATGGGGMEDGKFRVFDSCSEEVCNGVGAGMKGDSVEGRVF